MFGNSHMSQGVCCCLLSVISRFLANDMSVDMVAAQNISHCSYRVGIYLKHRYCATALIGIRGPQFW